MMGKAQLSIRMRSGKLFNSDIVFIVVAIVCLSLSLTMGAVGYFFGVAIVLLTLWSSCWDWSQLGLKVEHLTRSFTKAFAYAIAIFIAFDIFIQPIVELFFGVIDLSSFDGIRGNFIYYIFFILIMWVTAAIGEEFFYRGYLMKRIAGLFGDRIDSWFLASLLSAIYFGLAHIYQGWSGVITTGIIGFVFGLIFMKERNLLVPILLHGIYDMIGITLIYLDEERTIIEWINNGY